MFRTLPIAASSLVLLLIALACGGAGDGKPPSGGALYSAQGCAACHGERGEGKVLGPPLVGVEAHWTVESLADFLADPRAGLSSDPRLKALDQRYRTDMLSYAYMPPEDRALLAAFVLGLP